MNMQSQLTGRLARTPSFSLSTVELRGVSAEFDQSIKALPETLAQPVRVPTDTKGRGDFLKQLAAKSAAKLAAGSTALVLVLLSAESAQAQSSEVSLRTLDGVKSIEVLPDGTAEVTLENGAVMRLPAGSFTVSGSEVLVSEAVALQMTEAAAAGGGVSGGTLAAVGGGLALAGAAGGGGGGGGSSDGGGSGSTTAPTTGTVVDGYLVNATVFQDLNGNAIFDAGEPNTTTDAQGNYSITLDPSNPTAKIVSIGGTDSSTGQAFTGTLTAPAGSTVITPLTTLVQSLVEASADSDTPLTTAEANEQLAAALGLGSGTNLLELDPVEQIENASDPSDAAAFAAAAQVAAIISAAAATQDDAEGSSDASEAVAASLAQQLLDAAAGPGDPDPSAVLSDADAIAEALEEAEVEAGEASAIANSVQALNENIDEAVENADPGDLDALQNEIVANQEVAQGTLVDLVESGDIATTDPADLADEADNIVPLEPVVLSEDFLSTYGPSNLDSAPVMSGTGRPGSIVRVTFSDGDDATPDASQTTTVDGAGNWLFTFDAADFPAVSGAYTVEVAAAPSGSSVFTVPAVSGGSFDVDLTPPAAPVLGTVSSDDALALEERESDLTVSGTAEVGATVALTISGVTLTDNAAADGSFSVTFDASDIPDGDFTITAEATDSLGNTSDASDRDITVEPEANLDPTIDPVSGTLGSAELASGLTVTGTGRAGSTITVSIDGADQNATVSGDGTWSVTFVEDDLPDASGDYSVSAVATLPPTSFTSGSVDGGGFSVDLTAPDVPVIDTIAGNNALELEEQGTELTITGTAEAGATVEVTLNGAVETVVADAGGAFSVTFDAADAPGDDFSVSATATDALGNESSAATQPITVEPVSALTPTITPVSGTFGPTELAAGLVVSGTGRVGSTVTVDIDGVTQDATVDGDGNWTTTFAEADLPDATGDYSVSATATLAGTSFSSGSVPGGGFSVDLDAAAAPVLDAVAGNNAIELEESGADLTVTGTTDEGATVEVTIGGVTLTDVAGVGGVFSVTFDAADVPNSDFSISAVASDDLGNTSASATQAISVEPVSDLTPTVDPVSGVLGADDLASGLTVTGTGRAGSTVTVTIDAEDQEAVVDGDGNWSVTFGEADLPATTGDYAVSAVATLPPTAFTSTSVDGGGFSVDVTAPDAPLIDSVAGNNALELEEQDADLTITGTAEAGATVEVEIDGVVETTVADDGGVFSVTFDAADVPNAGFSISATATDAAGNTGAEATQAVTVEPVSNLTPTITPVSGTFGPTELAAGLVVSGMGRLGSTVTVTIDGQDQQAVVAPDGSWSVTFAEADLPDASGDYSVSAVATLPLTSLSSGSVDGGGFSVDVTAPDAPTLDTIAGDDFIDPSEQADDLVISGTAEAFSTVTVSIGAESQQATADVNGDFSVTFAAADVPTSNFQVTAVAEDALGNASAATDRSVLVGAVGQTITGTSGDDELSGTPGDDTINPEGNDGEAGGLDIINGSLGDDEIDLSTSGGTSFVELNYAALDGPINVTLDYANNTGSVDKGADGTDTLISPETPGEAFGIGLVGTQGDDTFTVVQDGVETWAGIFYEGGDDTVNVTLDTGIVRVNAVTTGPVEEDVTADLTTGDITFASGSIDLNVTGSGGQIELETGDGDDDVTGSDADERFILGAGTDTLDAGGGFDTVRYDRSVVTDGVTVNLQTGVATGIWDGQAFTHTLSNVERVRGSRTGDDMLTAANTGSRLEGRGGDDTLIGGDGDDLLIGGDGADTFFVGRGNDTIQDYQGDAIDTIELDPAYTEAEIDAAVAAAVQDGDAVVVTFVSTGATLRLEGWTVAELQAENAGGGSDVIGTPGDDVLDGTPGDDTINPEGNDGEAGGLDIINGSLGDDEIDLSTSGGTSFVELNYAALDGPINVTLDYANNTGSVDKGADGTDTLISPETPGEAFGIGLVGTQGDDTFTVVQDGVETWAGIFYEGGDDTVNVTLDTGIVRVNAVTPGAVDEDVTADLTTGDITFASGSIDLNVSGSGGQIELETGDGDDDVTGSDADERFILGAGTDALDAGGGFDTVRYDRSVVTDGVTVNLQTGVATGIWDGQAFTHTLSNVERVRGSRTGDDMLTAANTGSRLEGRGGDDTLIGGDGDDLLIGGDGADTFFVGRGNDTIQDYQGDAIDTIELDPAYTEAEIDAAVAAAVQDGDAVVVTFASTGATLRLEGWTVAELQAENAGGGSDIVGTSGNDLLVGTDGDDTIDPQGNDGNDPDRVIGSLGNDTIDLTNTGADSFVTLEYGGLSGPIDVTLDYSLNEGQVVKGVGGVDGTDTLINPNTTGEANGIDIFGTAADDTYTITQNDAGTFTAIVYAGGHDTVNLALNSSVVRVTSSESEDVTADLTTGDISFFGGSIDLNVTGSGGRVELVTGDGDDTVTGSALDERFILGAGNDTLDAGDGIDLVRYDRFPVSDGVTVNLETGVATGTWGGQAFSHSLSNVEQVRGSRTGGDGLTAADSGSFLDGRGGDDTLIGGAGDDVLVGGSGADTFFVGRGNDTIQDYEGDSVDTIELEPAYSEAEIDQAIADAVQDGDAVVVTFVSTGATVRFEGWTVADLQDEIGGSGSDIIGTFGDDVLDGTAGDDFIDPQGNDDGFDLINASTGDDEIDFSNSGGESFVELNYSVLDGPITASIDYANNTGFVDKGADGFDSLTNPNTTGESLGIGLVGTAGNDTYNITQGTGFSWAGVVYAGGNDVINASLNEGIVRVDTSGEATTADLSTGLISFASGSIQLNATGSGGRIELRTFDEDDFITGSDADERFILGAGTDTLDGGAGFDTVRYDRGDVTTGVTVNLATGIATGLWDGQAFEHSLSNVEAVRGSRTGDDTLTAADTDAFLDGRGGNDAITGGAGEDILIGGEGDDTLQGNAGEDLFIVGRGNDIIRDFEAGIDDIELDNNATDEEVALAVQNAEQIGDDVRITLPDGATILFEDWTVANFQQEYADRFAVNPIIGTDGPDVIDGTDGNDFINPLSSGDGDDVINGSLGDDEFFLSNVDSESFVELRYDGLTGPIEAFVDFANNNGVVNKGGDGVDTITDPLAAGEAFGLGISSTSGDDTINITQGSGFSWFGAFYAGGNDTINANLNSGIIRIDTGGGATTANLDTGDITFAGGSIDLNVTGSGGRIELRTFDEDDNVTGSDRDERFILGAGTDVLNAAGGYDVVRYDRGDVTTGVTVNLETGIATGIWDGQAFTHTLSNVEEVRGSRTGDDTLTAADTGSVLEGRGGVDTYTGGASEDIFIVGEGHDVVYNFDIDVDQLQARNGAFEFGLPDYEDVTFDGQASLRFNLSPDDSVTLVGRSAQDLENSIAEEILSLSPGRMNNPATLTVAGAGNLALIASDITEFLQTQSTTEFTFFEIGAAENYALSVTGSGLSLSGLPGSEVLSGTVDAATLTLDGSPVWSLTDLGIPFADFAAMLDSATNEGAIDYSLGLGARDLIVVADDAAQDIRIEGVDHWIEAGGGDDTVTFNGGGNAAIILGGGADTVDIAGGTPAEDRAFIYIDPADSGTNVINGFRFTDSEDSGDRIVVEEDLAVFSIAWEVDDATDQGDLDSIAATFDPIGPGEYALFFDQSGNAVLQDLIEGGAPGANYTLGDTIASFTNADVSGLSGSNVGGYNLDGFLVYSEIDLPPASELV